MFTHTWSLGVEAQFYLIFPLLVWLSGFARKQEHGSQKLAYTLLILAMLSLVGFIQLYSSHQSTAYFMMPFRFWELAVGCLVFLAMERQSNTKLTTTIKWNPGSSQILLAIIGIFFLPKSLAIPATVGCVGLTGLLIASLQCNGQSSKWAFKLLASPAILAIGRQSYSLYLWHWPVLAVSRWTIGIHWWTIPIQLGLIAFLSLSSYHLIEIQAKRMAWSGQRWLVHGLIAMISTSLLVVFVNRYFSRGIYSGDLKRERMENMIGKVELSTINEQNCTWFNGVGPSLKLIDATFRRCTMLPPGKTLGENNFQHLYIIGDSHAGNYIALLPMLATSHNPGITSLYVKALPPPLYVLQKKFAMSSDAMAQILITQQVLTRARAGDIILISRYLLEGTYSPEWVDNVKESLVNRGLNDR